MTAVSDFFTLASLGVLLCLLDFLHTCIDPGGDAARIRCSAEDQDWSHVQCHPTPKKFAMCWRLFESSMNLF